MPRPQGCAWYLPSENEIHVSFRFPATRNGSLSHKLLLGPELLPRSHLEASFSNEIEPPPR